MSLAIFLLACHGVTNIVTGGRIFVGLRAALTRRSEAAGHWIRCPMCFSLPVGVGWAALGLFPRTGAGRAVDLAAAGAVSSAWCWIASVALRRLAEEEPAERDGLGRSSMQ